MSLRSGAVMTKREDFSLDWPHGWTTRDGWEVRVLCTDRRDVWAIVGLIGPDEKSIISEWLKDGCWSKGQYPHPHDLINAPAPKRRVKGWIGGAVDTRADAISNAQFFWTEEHEDAEIRRMNGEIEALKRRATELMLESQLRVFNTRPTEDALRAENERLQALCDRLEMEAKCHAGEARAANATVAEVYQICSGETGEPGNWHGAEPVRQVVGSLRAELDDAKDRIEELERDGEVLSNEFEGELWVTCRQLLEDMGFDWNRDQGDGVTTQHFYDWVSEEFRDAKARETRLTTERDALRAEVERLTAELNTVNRLATDRAYLASAYRNMLGPKGREVADMWDSKGVTRTHVDWAPGAAKMTGEDRAEVLLGIEAALAQPKGDGG